MLLEQTYYMDADGHSVQSHEIEAVATFKYAVDGFFEWECPACKHREQSRAFKINGVVFTCPKCQKKALLLRSDVNFLLGMVSDYNKKQGDMNAVIRNALEHLGQAVTALGRRH